MDYEFEHIAAQKGYKAICGIDEAGRGPLAGPVCAAAVILPMDLDIPGLNDSKKLSEKKREALYEQITQQALFWAVEMVDEKLIDQINILQATFRAMEAACGRLPCDYALIDGNRMPSLKVPAELIVKGDAKSPSIAAASILAKVSRDRLMAQYALKYPEYGFQVHKGYGTKAHTQAILSHGPCSIHRMSFLKKLLNS